MAKSKNQSAPKAKGSAPAAAKKQTPSSAKKASKGQLPASKKEKPPTLRDIFEGAGFEHIESDGIHFKLKDRQCEIDHIFAFQNVLLLCEETTGSEPTKHCTNKTFFHSLIAGDVTTFISTYKPLNSKLSSYLGSKYKPGELEIRHIYYSQDHNLDKGVADNAAPFKILTRPQAAYFASLVKTIAHSAKYEILKYLGIGFHQIGKARLTGGGVSSDSFAGFALPGSHTNYPDGFAVVSFYADPVSLIQRAYVLRREGWESPDLSYQRFVRSEKLTEMRDYLSKNGKVFINNLIVTLPSKALMRIPNGDIVSPSSISAKTNVDLHIPLELGTVGIVDGQHRILAYFEGTGPLEASISALRERQNLLVTGIIFPAHYTPEMRVKFEAELFLSINNTQTGVATQLRQDLETLINPETPLAIARSIVNRLAVDGPLSGRLATSEFDPPDRIPTGSIGPYVLKQMVRPGARLHELWDPSRSKDLKDNAERKHYIDFCFNEILALLIGAVKNLQGKWKPVAEGGILSTTTIGGLILLLDKLLETKKTMQGTDYEAMLAPLANFDFTAYTSSQWGRMSNKLKEALGY